MFVNRSSADFLTNGIVACASQRFSNNNFFPNGNLPSQADIVNATVLLCIENAFKDLMNGNTCNPGSVGTNGQGQSTGIKTSMHSVTYYQTVIEYDEITFRHFSDYSDICQ